MRRSTDGLHDKGKGENFLFRDSFIPRSAFPLRRGRGLGEVVRPPTSVLFPSMACRSRQFA